MKVSGLNTKSESINRRTILKGLVALGAAGGDLATFAQALAQSSSEDVSQLTILIQGGPVAETINNVALPIFKSQYPRRRHSVGSVRQRRRLSEDACATEQSGDQRRNVQ
ncbi:hypothetical protein ACVWZL_001367 [Bradyrhizobium sp. GM2.4]